MRSIPIYGTNRIYRRMIFVTALLLTFLTALSAAAFADLFDEGKALHKEKRFAEAAVKLEQAAKESPNDARIWWQLNFTYHQLKRDSDALAAIQKAGQIDASHAFASEAGKYEQTLADRQRQAGSGNTTTPRQNTPTQVGATGETTAGSGRGNLTQQLVNGDVFVERGMNIDVGKLRQVTQELRPSVVKIVVFNSRANSRQLDREADRIRNFLKGQINQGQGYVIAASRNAVVVSSPSISNSDKKQLTDQVAPLMAAGHYTDGLVNLARGLVKEHAPRATSTSIGGTNQIPTVHHGPNWFLIFLMLIIVVFVVWMALSSIRKKNAMAARREPLERLKSQIISDMNYLEENTLGLDARSASRVKEARIAAGTKLDEAVRIMRSARSDQDLNRAQNLLDQAQGDIARGRSAMGGVPDPAPAPSSSGYSGPVPPVVGNVQSGQNTDWDRVPQDDKGVCFFCSRPARLSELTPVTVNLGGKQQKVLACENDLATIRTGQMPQIRAFQQNGHYVPWYAYQNYDPYRDYYNRGYGGGSFLSDMIMLNAIDNMFWGWHHPVGWGWGGYGGWGHGGNTYVFYPDHDHYRDHYSGQAAGYSDYSDIDRNSDASGTDFLQGTGGDSDYSGGSNYDTSSSYDSGSSFFGGGDSS